MKLHPKQTAHCLCFTLDFHYLEFLFSKRCSLSPLTCFIWRGAWECPLLKARPRRPVWLQQIQPREYITLTVGSKLVISPRRPFSSTPHLHSCKIYLEGELLARQLQCVPRSCNNFSLYSQPIQMSTQSPFQFENNKRLSGIWC